MAESGEQMQAPPRVFMVALLAVSAAYSFSLQAWAQGAFLVATALALTQA